MFRKVVKSGEAIVEIGANIGTHTVYFALGYKMCWHMPEMSRANNFFANPENVFGDAVSLNRYCIPKSRLPA